VAALQIEVVNLANRLNVINLRVYFPGPRWANPEAFRQAGGSRLSGRGAPTGEMLELGHDAVESR